MAEGNPGPTCAWERTPAHRRMDGLSEQGTEAGQMGELHLADFRMWLVQYNPHHLSTCVCVHICTQTHGCIYICIHQTQRHNHRYTYMYAHISIHAHTHAHIQQIGASSWALRSHLLSLTLCSHLPPVLGPLPLAPFAPLPASAEPPLAGTKPSGQAPARGQSQAVQRGVLGLHF